MKKLLLIGFALFTGFAAFSQTAATATASKTTAVTNTVKTPAAVQGTWMYGNFSLTEYWSTAPRTYLGNAFTFALAFKFNADGTYEHYFTSSVNNTGFNTYHQSVTKGKFKVDEAAQTITMFPASSHYKRTNYGRTEEERDMRPDELSKNNVYTYTTGTEPNGTKALYLTIQGTKSTLTFLKKS